MIKEFKLGAVKWKVKTDNKRLDDLGMMGLCEYTKAVITMHDELESEDTVNQTLYHEVTHAILDSIGEHKLSSNEEFVQKFAVLLHQFIETKK